METIKNTKRKYFTKEKKLMILEELKSHGMSISNLARKHDIHPITVHKWKREMANTNNSNEVDVAELLAELERTKKENDHLKKAVGELAIDKQILQAANEVLKKAQRKAKLKSPKKSSKK
jgi:transposase